MKLKEMHLFGGGTISHVRPHLALCAPAFGSTVEMIEAVVLGMRAQEPELVGGVIVHKHLTAMAGGDRRLMTNADIAHRLDQIIARPEARFVFMSAAMCDFDGSIVRGQESSPSGKDQPRLHSNTHYTMRLSPAEKVIRRVRAERKDIFLVGFKTTAGAEEDEMFEVGLGLLKKSSCNLVLANDIHTRTNMIITPEQARYHVTRDRFEAIRSLVEMSLLRSRLHFTRSTVVPGDAVPWASPEVPPALRRVVDHCVDRGAYKAFQNKTVGHFAAKLGDGQFLTSIRNSNFNQLDRTGMVHVEADGDDRVIAHGFRPSVGGQSQRIIFREHPGTDCIVHFHCQKRPGSPVPVREQRPYECGSHECGQNTSDGLADFDGIKAVMLDKHGPNIVFGRDMDPDRVIGFIEQHFDLDHATSEASA